MENKKDNLRKIRTFSLDVKEKIKDENLSLSDMAIAEAERDNQKKIFSFEKEKKGGGKIIFYSIAGLIIAIVSILITISIIKKITELPPYTGSIQDIVSRINGIEEIITTKNTERSDFIMSFQKSVDSLSKENNRGIMSIFPVYINKDNENKENLKTSQFFEILDINPPSIIKRNLLNNFFLGFSLPEKEGIIIIKLEDGAYGAGFSGMIEWEKKIENDLGELIKKQNSYQDSYETNDLVLTENSFNSKNIRNYDVRYKLDNNGKIKMLYSVINDSTILITGGESSFESVLPILIK